MNRFSARVKIITVMTIYTKTRVSPDSDPIQSLGSFSGLDTFSTFLEPRNFGPHLEVTSAQLVLGFDLELATANIRISARGSWRELHVFGRLWRELLGRLR